MSETIDWTFGGTWPYEPRWFDHADGKMHYIDEGPREARPVVLVHGNPTWAYLYRHFIAALLEAGYRVIAMDHLGFGRSDKPDEPELHRIPRHGERCIALLESLELQDATIVVQDWGGPIGLAWAAEHPERVRSLAVLNTFVRRPHQKVQLPLPLKLFRTPGVGEVMVKGLNAFVNVFLFRAGLYDTKRLGPVEKAAYRAPHPRWRDRTGMLVFPREIPAGPEGPVSDYVDEINKKLVPAFREKPVLIAWPMNDVAFTPDILDEMWIPDFPHADVHRLEKAGHYVQEDAHERVLPLLLVHLERGSSSGATGQGEGEVTVPLSTVS
ncbi:MAG: alpha/beta fold hydrolase [Acidobacteriota bacterium]